MDQFKQIVNTLNFKLSLSNIELYHSNLLATVLDRNKDIPFSLLSEVIDNYNDFKVVKVEREKKHRDLTIFFSNVKKEIKVIVEDKFKSLPDSKQLLSYMDNNVYNFIVDRNE